MNLKNTILIELETLAPTLINVPKTFPYSIRSGYFENLPAIILDKLKIENDSNYTLSIDNLTNTNPYAAPNGFFDGFADLMLTKAKMENEVNLDLPITPINPYVVASNYFDTLSDIIIQRIKALETEANSFHGNFTKITPYQIPVGYFDNLAAVVLNKVKGLANEDSDIVFNFTKTNPYTTPVKYFDDFANNILGIIKESDGHESIIIEQKFTKFNPYKVPLGYFEGLSNEILLKINPSTKQEVPAGYFASLPDIILQKVRGIDVASELEEIAPLLNTINKTPLNHVPSGYFEQLEATVVSPEVVEVAPAKVIGLRKKTNWFKNAVAACLIGTLGFTAYQLMDNASTPHITSIQTASNEQIDIPLPTGNINVDEELAKVDDATLASYLDDVEMPTEQATAHFNDVNSGDVDKALQDIPAETIQQHLEETGGLTNKNN